MRPREPVHLCVVGLAGDEAPHVGRAPRPRPARGRGMRGLVVRTSRRHHPIPPCARGLRIRSVGLAPARRLRRIRLPRHGSLAVRAQSAGPNRTGTIFFLAIATEPPTGPRHVAPRTTVPSITSVVGRPRAPVSADAGLGGVQGEDGRIHRRPTTTIDIDRSTSMCRPFQPGGRLAPSHPITYFLVLKWTDGDWGVRSHV